MNTTKANTSKLLLIILGVLVAIVIGFSSSVGAKGLINWNSNASNDSAFEHQAKEIFKKSAAHINKKMFDMFTTH